MEIVVVFGPKLANLDFIFQFCARKILKVSRIVLNFFCYGKENEKDIYKVQDFVGEV